MSEAPSPVISYFVKEIGSCLPADQKEKLATYVEAVAKTTLNGDIGRAWHCADWAIQTAENSPPSQLGHLVRDLKESHTLWKDSIFGAGFGEMREGGIGPGHDIEIQWVDDAVAVAKTEGERAGWDSVRWEDLLKRMLAVGPQE
jgi:hypothetical protein